RTVLQAELPLEQIEFAPIVLEFAIGDGSATPRLHVAGTVLSGDRFPVAATAEDRSANPFSSVGGALDAIPDTIGGEEPARAHASAGELRDVRLLLVGADRDGAFSRSFSLAPPSVRADGGEDERAALLDARHVVTVVTGTPSIEYLVHDFAMATEDASVPQARLLNHFALGYFYLRSLLPASPDREALRFIDGANVLTTSVYPTADDSFAIVMNLARKRYGLLARD